MKMAWIPSLSKRALCLFILAAAAPASATSVTNPGLVYLPGDAALAPAAGKQLSPAIASGGDGYLVVWVDDRTAITSVSSFSGGPAFDHHIGAMWDIYAARLDADGNLIDSTPIIIAQQIQNQGMPDVAWNGENWLVVWSGQAGMQCCPNIHMFAARVSPGGVVLDSSPIVIDTDFTGNGLYWPCASSDGTNWVVVWRDLDQAAGIFTLDGARVAPNGTVLDPGGVRLRRDTFNSYPVDPDVVFGSGEYLLVWTENMGRVRGQRLAPNLTKIGGVFAVNTYTPSEGYNPRVATNGTDYLVTWWEDRYDGWSQLAGARVSQTGAVLDPAGIALTEASGYTNYEPAVDWDGSNYVVVYDKSAFPPIDLFATRVTAAGAVLDYGPDAILVSSAPQNQWEAAVAHRAGSGSLVVWSDNRYSTEVFEGYGDIFAAPFAANGTVGGERCVSLGAPRQTRLRLVPNGAGFLAVYRSETSPETRILVQRIDSDGAAIDLEPIVVAQGGSTLKNPRGAWSGSEYLIVWEDSGTNRTLGRRLAPDLALLDPAPLVLLPGNTPDVAAVGGVFLVVASYEQPHEIRQIYSQRVQGSDGAILDGAPRVVGPNFSLYPRVAAFAGTWLVTWERHPSHDDPGTSVLANVVAANGVSGTYFVAGADGEHPAVTAGPDQALIAWEQPGTSQLEIFASRWLPDGTRLDPYPIAITAEANSQFDAAVAWSGDGYGVAFGDFRNDETLESHRGDLYGSRIGADGSVLNPEGFAVANDTIPEMFPDVAAVGGAVITGGSVFRQDAGFVAYRIALAGPTALTGVDPGDTDARPMLQVVSNPLVGPGTIALSIERPGMSSVRIFDTAGREVRRLLEGHLGRGTTRLAWDLRDGSGRPVSAGMYFVRARTPEGTSNARVVVLHR